MRACVRACVRAFSLVLGRLLGNTHCAQPDTSLPTPISSLKTSTCRLYRPAENHTPCSSAPSVYATPLCPIPMIRIPAHHLLDSFEPHAIIFFDRRRHTARRSRLFLSVAVILVGVMHRVCVEGRPRSVGPAALSGGRDDRFGIGNEEVRRRRANPELDVTKRCCRQATGDAATRLKFF